MEPLTVEHTVRRIQIPLPGSFSEVRERYESLVPVMDPDAFAAVPNWAAAVALAEQVAPHGFMRYFSTDVAAAMAGSATAPPTVQYLMGNHTIAERMYRHDPAVMLHAPLRVVLFKAAADDAIMVFDQPSRLFASYGSPAIGEVGEYLDKLVAGLIGALGGDPSPLRA
ncbi:DUF302 domain-containing protein [Mycolicibacter arupensis]|uniref:DUF302 domain-containing protein n=1 Tax=Mycolicibacter arupensis TaxID=342002 RepID=UPI001F397A98|nr:DUF302 domain-containing protein [Mycolicibacter arupensis]